MPRTLLPVLLSTSLLLSACGGGGGTPSTPFTLVSPGIIGLDLDNVYVEPALTLRFSDDVADQSAAAAVTLKDAVSGAAVPVRVVTAHRELGVFPTAPLQFEHQYTLTIAGLKGANGGTLQAPFNATFKTEKHPLTFIETLVSVTRYQDAQATVVIGNTSGEDIAEIKFSATCREATYSNLSTQLSADVANIKAGEVRTVYFNYSGGYRYFTDQTVGCDFSGTDPLTKRRVVISKN